MKIQKLSNGAIVIEPQIFHDERGYFFESFNLKQFNEETGMKFYPVQDNESKSEAGVIRGLHFQKPPYEQAKLVRVIQGGVFDIAVDLRQGSPTYGKWDGVFLSDTNHKQFFIPEGYAHGFIALEHNTIFQYKCNDYYNKTSEGAINIFDDNITNTEGSITLNDVVHETLFNEGLEPILSSKDKNNPFLKDIITPFYYYLNLKYWNDSKGEEYTDEMLFKNTEYNGMKFTRLSDWSDFDSKHYASPIFSFENGDLVVFNKYGNIEKMKYEI